MKRMWLTTTLVMCGLVQAAIGWNIAHAEDDVAAGEKLLPKSTLLFVSVPDVPETRSQFQKSLFGSMLNDKEFKPFFDQVQDKIKEASDKLQDELGVTVSELLALPQGEITFAVLEKPTRKISIVLMFDYGDNKETVEKLLKKMHDALDGDVAEHSAEDVDDVKVHTYAFKDSDESSPFKQAISYFNDEQYLVFSNEVEALKEVLQRWDGKSDDTLADNDAFKYIQAQCKDESGEPTLVWYFNPIGLINAGLNVAQAYTPQVGMAGAFLPMFGVDKLKGLGGAGYGASGDFETVWKSFSYVEQPASGLVNVFLFPATDLAPPKWVPADASVYMGANWNFAKAYTAIEGMVDMFQGRGALARLLDQQANNDPGIHFKKDIFDLLDGKFHIVQSVGTKDDPAPTPQFLIAVEVKDPAKAKKTLSKIAKSEKADFETREFNGETIYEIPTGETTLSMAIVSGQFVFTNDTPTLEGMLRSERQPSLADSPAYRKISKHFPAKTSMISFQRSDAQVKAAYDLLKTMDQGPLEGFDMSKLPPFESLEKYLRPSGSYMVPDKKGALTVSFELREGDR